MQIATIDVYVCVCLCECTPQRINNNKTFWKFEQLRFKYA